MNWNLVTYIPVLIVDLTSTSCCVVTPVRASPSCYSTSTALCREDSTRLGRDQAPLVWRRMSQRTQRRDNLYFRRMLTVALCLSLDVGSDTYSLLVACVIVSRIGRHRDIFENIENIKFFRYFRFFIQMSSICTYIAKIIWNLLPDNTGFSLVLESA